MRTARRARGARDLAHQRILATVDSIPRGSVASYGQVARAAGLPRHARLVGFALRALPAATALPWHRVVNAAGGLSTRGAARSEQRRRLAAEGVAFLASGRVDLKRHAWRSG
jgi:methylated-DNA-protein-cysteine methyltransferase-like protein